MSRVLNYSRNLESTATRRAAGRSGIKPLVHPPSELTATPLPVFLAGEPVEAAEALSIERRFRDLVRQWKDATEFTSSTTQMVMHPAYQQIIGMGKEVLPLLLAELRRKPDHWFWALKAITREDPVAAADRGKVRRMAEAWLDWAEHHGV